MQKVSISLPSSVQKYFWGDNLAQLDWQLHQKYILQTLLEKADRPELHWLFSQVPKETVRSYLPQLRLSKKSANFWSIYLS